MISWDALTWEVGLPQTDRNEDGAASGDLRGIGDDTDGGWPSGIQTAHAQLVCIGVRLHAEHSRGHRAASLQASGGPSMYE